MTLREAAERTSRSITTLRRYIRSGRLRAEKRYGRFGPEYFVSEEDLSQAGLEAEPQAGEPVRALTPRATNSTEALTVAGAVDHALLREIVPLSLYSELRMKHEQLLVQYGMVRAGGLRAMEAQAELEAKQSELERAHETVAAVRREMTEAVSRLKRELRQANLELRARALEIEALHEKVKALEMLTRNAVTNETIDKQFHRVMEQSSKVRELSGERREPSDH